MCAEPNMAVFCSSLTDYYNYYYLLQLSFHSVAVALTLVTNKNKYTEKKQNKNKVYTNIQITKTQLECV